MHVESPAADAPLIRRIAHALEPGSPDNPIVIEDTSGPAADTDVTSQTDRPLRPFRMPPCRQPSPNALEIVEESGRDPESSGDDESNQLVDAYLRDVATRPHCPFCGSRFDPDFLVSDGRGIPGLSRSISYEAAQQFCDLHKTQEALVTWQERGYPKINWPTLEQRTARYYGHMKRLLVGAEESVCARRLQDASSNRSGHHTLLASPTKLSAAMSAGYYGPRGLDAIGQLLAAALPVEIRAFVEQDPLGRSLSRSLSFAGVIQAILAPEVVLLLVQEDMRCGRPRAMRILEESDRLGALLHPESMDVDETARPQRLSNGRLGRSPTQSSSPLSPSLTAVRKRKLAVRREARNRERSRRIGGPAVSRGTAVAASTLSIGRPTATA